MNVPSKVGDEAVIIIALDIGSSSIRCTAYKYLRDNNNDEHNDDDFVVLASSRRPRRSIQENGQILLDGLFDDIDALMDEIHTSLASTCTESHPIHVVAAIGITSFVMNLIGVDVHSKPIMNPAATLSYACQSKQVDEELVKLKR
jgi:sugar (pentulose or hexulose) kinase